MAVAIKIPPGAVALWRTPWSIGNILPVLCRRLRANGRALQEHMSPTERLVVMCARVGLCSRNEATRYVKLGLVAVNGEVMQQPGAMVSTDAFVELLDRGKRMQANKVTLMLHKPLHYVTCRAPAGEPLARKLLVPANRAQWCRTKPDPRHLSKLDAADVLDPSSSGLLLFSQDGRVATKVSRDPDLEKEYMLEVAGSSVSDSQLIALREGLLAAARSNPSQSVSASSEPPVIVEAPKSDAAMASSAAASSTFAALRAARLASKQAAAPATGRLSPTGMFGGGTMAAEKASAGASPEADSTWLRVLLRACLPSQQIRQVCSLSGLRVVSVARTRIGRIRLGHLKVGEWTVVRADEVLDGHAAPNNKPSLVCNDSSPQPHGKRESAVAKPSAGDSEVQGSLRQTQRQPRVMSWKHAQAKRH